MNLIRAWYIWLAAGLFYLYEFIHRVAPSVMVPELMADFTVSAATIGSISAFYYYSYAFIQIPVGLLLDRYGTKFMLSFAAFTITTGSLLFSFTESIAIAKFSRLLIGFGSAFSFVGCLKLGASWFPSHRFAFVVGLTNLLGASGAVLGGQPLAILVDKFNWRLVMLGSALIGLIFIVVLYLVISDKPIENNSKQPIENISNNLKSFIDSLISILKSRQLWLIAIFGSCMVAPIAAYSEIWGVTFLTQKNIMDRSLAAQIISLTFIGIAIGGPTIGWLSGYMQSKKIPLLIGTLGSILCFSLIIYTNNSILIFKLLHFLFGFFTSSMLLCFSLATSSVSNSNNATAIGFINTVIMGLSAILQPFVGWLLDKNSNYINDYHFDTAFIGLTVCQILAFIVVLFINDRNHA